MGLQRTAASHWFTSPDEELLMLDVIMRCLKSDDEDVRECAQNLVRSILCNVKIVDLTDNQIDVYRDLVNHIDR